MIKKTHNKYKKIKKYNAHVLKKGSFGLKVNCFKRFETDHKIQAHLIILKKLKQLINKKKIKIWSNLNLSSSLTKLNVESRMGKGKGNVYTNAVFLKPGNILYEFDEISHSNKKELSKYFSKSFFLKVVDIHRYNN